MKNLFIKNEGENPTGSFKDRGMTIGVSKALEMRKSYVMCASTGNTSASLAAYAAKGGLECVVLVPYEKIALGKIAQAIAYGARIVAIKGNFDDALNIARRLCNENPEFYLLNSINPYRLEGQKTISFEVVDQLRKVPDKVIVPVGNAGNISAIWKGFKELFELGIIDELPKMIGIQAKGADPLVKAFKLGFTEIKPIKKPETEATAIRIGYPVNWKKAMRAVRESGGIFESVTDKEILIGQQLLARTEGILIEPASAAAIAGLIKLTNMGLVEEDEIVVCICTGNGLKDPQYIIRNYKPQILVIRPEVSLIRKYIFKQGNYYGS